MVRHFTLLLSGVLLTGMTLPSQAQVLLPKQGDLTLMGSNGSVIAVVPIQGSPTIRADGDLLVECNKAGPESTCPNLFSTSTLPPPTGTITTSKTSLYAGDALTLSWSSTGQICMGETTVSPSLVAWNGFALDKSGYRRLYTLPVGDHVFKLRCFTTGGAITVSTPVIHVLTRPINAPEPVPDPPNPGEPTPAPPVENDYCKVVYPTPPTSPNFTAFGLQKREVTFEQGFGTYPGGKSSLLPVARDNLPVGNYYLTISFVMAATTGPDSQMILNYGLAQPPNGPSGASTVTISPCPGDFRPPSTAGGDPYLRGVCRGQYGVTGKLFISSRPGDNDFCQAPLGKTMYLNVVTRNMYGSTLGPTLCPNPAQPCGLVMQIN